MWLFHNNNWVMPAGALIIATAVYWVWDDATEVKRSVDSQSVAQHPADRRLVSFKADGQRTASERMTQAPGRNNRQQTGVNNAPSSWSTRTGGRQSPATTARGGQAGSTYAQTRNANDADSAQRSRDAEQGALSGGSQTAGVIIQPNPTASTSTATESGNDIIPGIEDMDAQTALAEVRDLIVNDGPSGLLQLMGARPVSRDGNVLGYQINPPEGVYLDSIGIQPGDIVMEINGVALNNPDNINSIIMGLLFSTSIEMKLERDGVIETVKR